MSRGQEETWDGRIGFVKDEEYIPVVTRLLHLFSRLSGVVWVVVLDLFVSDHQEVLLKHRF